MNVDELEQLIFDKTRLNYKTINVAVNSVGHLDIDEILWCDHCDQYHITLKEKK